MLSKADLAAIRSKTFLKRLGLYAYTNLKKEGLTGEYTANDLVNPAVIQILNGNSAWKKEQCSLFQFLSGVIRSDISNIRSKIDRQKVLRPEITRKDKEDSNSELSIDSADVRNLPDNKPSDEELIVFEQQKVPLYDFLEKNDPLLKRMAMYIIDDRKSGSVELAEELQLTVEEVNKAKKRLRKLILEYLASPDELDSAKTAR